MTFDQVAIAILGSLAIWLSQQKQVSRAKWACIIGMAGQPFWFYASWKAEQWGIFFSTALYCYAWWIGFKRYWLLPYLESKG